MIPRGRAAWVCIALVSVLGTMAAVGWALARWTDVPLLLPEEGAEWIRPDIPFLQGMELASPMVAVFRTGFRTAGAPPRAILTVRAMKAGAVSLDGRVVLAFPERSGSWKNPRQVDLAPYLTSGYHRLEVAVFNWNGPVLLLAYCRELGLTTGETWEAGADGSGWRRVLTAGETPPVPDAVRFSSAATAFFDVLPILTAVFLPVFGFSLALDYGRSRFPWIPRLLPRASHLRWMMLAAWALLGLNNIGKIPLWIGFDVSEHLDYIGYVLTMKRIPLATEGWSMYHPPLYYILSALTDAFWRLIVERETADWLMRIIPLLCGALQIEVAFRAMRRIFPDRDDLQVAGTVVAGWIPMNVYISQSISNEPMAALLTAVVVLLCVGIVVPQGGDRPLRRLILLGITLGLALLTKVSALFLVPVVIGAAAWGLRSRGWPLCRIAAGTALVLGTAVLISGWFYIRNAIVLGKPFVANWDPESGMVWWQGPGFRTPGHLLAFGDALIRPVYSGVYRFWDSIYSTFWLDGYLSGLVPGGSGPPWNYDLMIAGAWLGLVPTSLIILGAGRTLARPLAQGAPALFLSIAAVSVYFGALLLFATSTPHYSTAKAFYALGLLPCFGILAAAGFEPLLRRPLSRAFTWALVSCWAVASYGAYFVVR